MDKRNLDELVSNNQFIKLVPSLEDSLRTMGLDVDLDETTNLQLKQLFTVWRTWKKSATVDQHIEMYFRSSTDQFRVALIAVIKCNDFKDCKPKSLPFCIIEFLQKWSHDTGVLPDESLKFPAFHVAIQQRNQRFLNLMVKTYGLFSIKDDIVPLVRNLIINDNNKQATQIVSAMELFDDIPVQDLLFPLVLQDKSNMIDEYLSECPSQVEPFLLFLDTLVDKNISLHDYVQNYLHEKNISNVKFEKIHYKVLSKLAARLCRKFKIPIETCKNLSKNRTIGGLRYLIYQKYLENKLSSSVWDDLVKDSLNQNADSALEFITTLSKYDRKEALKWADYLNMSKNDLPIELKEENNQNVTLETENWDSFENKPQEYYKLPLSDDQIIIIDTCEKFFDLMIGTLTKCNVVSFDCEWKPSFLATQSQVALIQISTKSSVYLIDTLVLNKEEYSSFWHTFHKRFLNNPEIIKLGFGIEQDLKEVKGSIMGLSNVKDEGLLDLQILWKTLINEGLVLPTNSDHNGNSLSFLVQSCFGLPLAKSEQCSNWELRPLRKTQILYAALDAYVLLEIYDFLLKKCVQQGINFDEICNNIIFDKKVKSTKKVNTVAERIQNMNQSKLYASDVKLLIEPSLSSLMCYLRYCGIDTVVMKTTMLWVDIINLAMSENRLLIVTKLKCSPTVNYPQSNILHVGKTSIKDQMQKILDNFNIEVRESDIFTRCIRCNETDIKRLSPTEVQDICNEYQSSCGSNVNGASYVCDYNDEEIEYGTFLSDSDDCDDIGPTVTEVAGNKSCRTAKDVPIEIHNVKTLSHSDKTAILCNLCGKLYWDGDISLKPVEDLMFKLTKLKCN